MDLNQPRDDPHGVQRLLDILRRQQGSSSSSASTAPLPQPSSAAHAPSNPFLTATTSGTQTFEESEAAKRRRQYSHPSSKYGIPTSIVAEDPFDPYSFNPFSSSAPILSQPPPPSPPKPNPMPKAAPVTRDLSTLSFSESLPILSTLANDKGLLRRLKALRTQQHELEKRLVKEYRQFASIADKQYPNPKVRAQEDEKRRKQMMKQWDESLKKQQEELERAGVPTFRKTGEKREVEKQKKVLGVLVEMLDDTDD